MQQESHGVSLTRYIAGLVIAVILTLAAFLPVMNHWLADWSTSAIIIYLLGLALVQMLVQIVFFLHLTDGPDATYNLMAMWTAVICVFVIIAGTWWTMWKANYQVMGGAGRVEQSDVIYSHDGAPLGNNAGTTLK